MNKKKRFLIHEAQKKMIKSAKARVIGNSITTEAVCQRNSPETTEQNFMKLGR
jgi:hypothetical protein